MRQRQRLLLKPVNRIWSIASLQEFKPVAWAQDTNIYEVNLRQYTQEGTFNAFIKELPRLRDMGIEIFGLCPLRPSVKKKGWAHWAAIMHAAVIPKRIRNLARSAILSNLVAAAHELGFKVLIDWVANHTGWDHEWTTEHPEFYRRNLDGHFYDAHGWDDVIDLNYDNETLRQAMISCHGILVGRM